MSCFLLYLETNLRLATVLFSTTHHAYDLGYAHFGGFFIWVIKMVKPILRYIPLAVYEIGVFHYGDTKPYKVFTAKADNRSTAMELAITEFRKHKFWIVEHIKIISVKPNPEYLEAHPCR